MLKRLEAWAADSPERSRMLVLALCLGIGALVALFILALAWVVLGMGDAQDLVE
jgi:hypothetical protein